MFISRHYSPLYIRETLEIGPRRSNQAPRVPPLFLGVYSPLPGAVGPLGTMIPIPRVTNSVPGNHAVDPGVEYDPSNVRVSQRKMWDL